MMNNLKFATKLLLVILGVSIISMITVSTISYMELLNLSGYAQDVNIQLGFYASDNSKDALIGQAETYMSRLSASQAASCNEVLANIQSDVMAMSGYIEDLYKNQNNFRGRRLPLPYEVPPGVPTAKMMIAKGAVMSSALEREMLLISNAEYMFGNIFALNQALNNAYLGTATGINFRYSKLNVYNSEYDPRTRPWYTTAYNAGKPIWLDTYVDPFGDVCTTCAKAYKDADGNTAGVVAADILLSTMVEDILGMRIGETGYAFLLDEKGRYLAHPHYDELDPDALGTTHGDYREVLAGMAAGESGVRKAAIATSGGADSTDYYIAYAPLPVTGWSLGIAVEYDEIISGALSMKSSIDSQALVVKNQIRAMLNSVMFRFIALTCVIIIAVLILSILVSGSVTKPMIKLTNSVIEVGKGNLDIKIDIQTKDEIGVLAGCFNKMTDDLTDYIANLSKVTAEKERIGAELDVATKIQASMLPCIFPAFPQRSEFDIYATMRPAREVGGDFYDLFLIDNNTLAVVVADVSGKGIPAALFMVIAKTLIKNNAQYGKSPKEVFEIVNNLLCENNEAMMFVTAILGYLDIPSGRFTSVNAAHNPPLIKKAGAAFDWLKTKSGFVLAGMENMQYTQSEIILQPGDELFLYTDGVTEAMNKDSKLFGEERLLEAAGACRDLPLKVFDEKIKGEIDKFADGAEQADDITMLMLRYKGKTHA